MKAILFDLDDTLYPEIDFVRSGFRAVASYLGSQAFLDKDHLFERMVDMLEAEGRGRIFDRVLREQGLYSPDLVQLLIYVYRTHEPAIELFDEVASVLPLLRRQGLELGIVTDGTASVQRRKIRALGLDPMVDVIVCTDELGEAYWKPSLIPFWVALRLLDVEPEDAAYVGDDPQKDFIAPKQIGMWTVRVRRLAHKVGGGLTAGEPGREADVTVDTLAALPSALNDHV